ncbi:MAG TPA: chalcone isomerase family protein [Myxococcaceae bacterium]|nr:chalcone isomerase family protein [Myxococcaceae bacterium]
MWARDGAHTARGLEALFNCACPSQAEMLGSMKLALAATLALFAPSAPALAKEVSGITLPESATVAGKPVVLNGAGVRKKFVFKVYVAGLYVETPSRDEAMLLSSDQVKQIQLWMLRDLDRKQIVEAIRKGFERNARARMPALQARLDQFTAKIPDVKKGSQLVITYQPGVGTQVSGAGESTSVPGKDFADALLSVWLGDEPVDGGLKKGLLGGS